MTELQNKMPEMPEKVAFSTHGARAGAEMRATVFAAVGYRLVICAFGNGEVATRATNRLSGPAAILKELSRRFLIWDLAEDLEGAEGFGHLHRELHRSRRVPTRC